MTKSILSREIDAFADILLLTIFYHNLGDVSMNYQGKERRQFSSRLRSHLHEQGSLEAADFLPHKIKNLPSSPGVYLMKESRGGIIYVGKANNLKRRVQSYFHNSKSHSPKVEKLVKHLTDFDYLITDTEFEAFMLECQLIKQLKPLNNKKMKSPLSYTYIVIQMDDEYPGIAITNSRTKKKNHHYFGPFTSKGTVERALQAIKEFYKIMCTKPTSKDSTCLNHSLGLCIGMCLGGTPGKQYRKIINNIINLLNGTDLSILKDLEQRMLDASNNFDFETAAKYRDYSNTVNSLINKTKVISFTEDNKSIVIIEPLNKYTVKLFLVKRNQIVFSEKYFRSNLATKQLCAIIKTNILTFFKTKELNSSVQVNSDELDELQIIYSYLNGSNCKYVTIPESWIENEVPFHLDEAINKLLLDVIEP